MAAYSNSRKIRPKPFTLDSFGGLDPGGSDGSFTSIVNFRIKNGRMVKRSGTKLLETYPAEIRGLWFGDFDGEAQLFCVAGDKLYRGTGTARTEVGTLLTDSGRVCIYFRRGKLYLLDGTEFYSSDGQTVSTVEGYVPTIRISSDETLGTAYCDRNRLTNRVRMKVNPARAGDVYPIWGNVAEIEDVTLNGSPVDYTLKGSGTSTTIAINSVYGELIVTYRLVDEGYREDFVKHLYSLSYSSLGDDTVFLYGGETKSRVIYSGWADGSPRFDYFPVENRIDAGTGDRPVTSLLRQYDSIMLFTSGETYMAEPERSENSAGYMKVSYPLYTLNPNIGSCGFENARQADDHPVSLSRDGVHRWIETDTQGERTAQLISERIDTLLTSSILANAITHVCRRHGEYWIYSGGEILVYNIKSGLWYSFSGINADGFIETDETCYWSGDSIYSFDDSLGTDCGTPFEASCETGFIDFGYPHLNKRLHRAFVSFDASEKDFGCCRARLDIIPDESDPHTIYGLENAEEIPVTLRFGCEVPRFCFLRLRLSDDSGAAMSLSQIGLQYHLLSESGRGYAD